MQTAKEEEIRQKIRLAREALVAIENAENGSLGASPESVWHAIKENQSEGQPIGPMIAQAFSGHIEKDSLERYIKRLENDLGDLENIESSHQLFDPQENTMEEHHSDIEYTEQQAQEEDNQSTVQRDEEQRPLSAYRNSE